MVRTARRYTKAEIRLIKQSVEEYKGNLEAGCRKAVQRIKYTYNIDRTVAAIYMKYNSLKKPKTQIKTITVKTVKSAISVKNGSVIFGDFEVTGTFTITHL